MHTGFFLNIQRLHQVDFDLQRAVSGYRYIFVNIFLNAFVRTRDLQTEGIDPQFAQSLLVGTAHCDLL